MCNAVQRWQQFSLLWCGCGETPEEDCLQMSFEYV